MVHDGLARGDEPEAELARQPRRPVEAAAVQAVVARARHQVRPGMPPGERPGPRQPGLERPLRRRMQEEVRAPQAIEVLLPEQALALLRPPRPLGQQPAEPSPAGPVARQRGELRPRPGEAEPGPRDETGDRVPGAGRLAQLLVRPDQPRHRVAVGDGEGRQAELHRPVGVLLRVAAPGQEGEVRGDAELGEGHGRAQASGPRARGHCGTSVSRCRCRLAGFDRRQIRPRPPLRVPEARLRRDGRTRFSRPPGRPRPDGTRRASGTPLGLRARRAPADGPAEAVLRLVGPGLAGQRPASVEDGPAVVQCGADTLSDGRRSESRRSNPPPAGNLSPHPAIGLRGFRIPPRMLCSGQTEGGNR